MTEQLWGIGGVVAGVMASGGTGLLVERTKLALTNKASLRATNRTLCEALLASVEKELKAAEAFQDQHGVFPVDEGYDPRGAGAREMLTEVELRCPRRILDAAEALIGALERYLWHDGNHREQYRQARALFISEFRKL